MNQLETDLWQLLRKKINGYSTRIENVISSGFPDVVTVNGDQTILIELKVEKKGWVYFRTSQISFFVRTRKVKGKVWILSRAGDYILITSSNELLKLTGVPYKEGYMRYKQHDITDISIVWAKPWDWTHVNAVLFTAD